MAFDYRVFIAGRYGGGGGARRGGSGGGGGYSRMPDMSLEPRQLVHVTVGHAGSPSYGSPGPGLVIVMWGHFRLDDYREYDLLDPKYCCSSELSVCFHRSFTSNDEELTSGEKEEWWLPFK